MQAAYEQEAPRTRKLFPHALRDWTVSQCCLKRFGFPSPLHPFNSAQSQEEPNRTGLLPWMSSLECQSLRPSRCQYSSTTSLHSSHTLWVLLRFATLPVLTLLGDGGSSGVHAQFEPPHEVCERALLRQSHPPTVPRNKRVAHGEGTEKGSGKGGAQGDILCSSVISIGKCMWSMHDEMSGKSCTQQYP